MLQAVGARALCRVHMMAHRVYLYCRPQQYTVTDADLTAVQEAAVEVAVEILACGRCHAAADMMLEC